MPSHGRDPLDRAWSLLARVQVWFGADDWHDLQRRARVLDSSERRAAVERLTEVTSRRPQSQAMRVLVNAARTAPANASLTASPASRGRGARMLSRDAREETGRLLEQAVLAILFVSELDPDDVALLIAPVLGVVRDTSEHATRTAERWSGE